MIGLLRFCRLARSSVETETTPEKLQASHRSSSTRSLILHFILLDFYYYSSSFVKCSDSFLLVTISHGPTSSGSWILGTTAENDGLIAYSLALRPLRRPVFQRSDLDTSPSPNRRPAAPLPP